jgi:hypothetical protein
MKIQEVHLFSRITRSIRAKAAYIIDRSPTLRAVGRDTLTGIFKTTYHAVTVIGLAALATSALMFYSPSLATQLKVQITSLIPAGEPSQVAHASVPMDMPDAVINNERSDVKGSSAHVPLMNEPQKKFGSDLRQQQSVANWISKRYRVAADATDMLVSTAYTTSSETKLDPLLILAVVAIESGFNPFAESAVGAQGLMQVMSKIHHEKFQRLGGIKAALNPVANIKVGSSILKEYVARGGSVEAGLKMYVGAAAFDNDAGYGSRVLAEYRRLKEVAAGRSVPTFSSPIQVTARAPQKSIPEVVIAPQSAPVVEDKPVLPEASSSAVSGDKVAAM